MNTPLVSIIIPTFNRAHLIGETLDSILLQTYANWECIVVDDGSKEDTECVVMDYVKKDTRIQYHKRPENRPKGACACRNYGFELSKGEYVNWFDSDDVMLQDFIKSKVSFFTPQLNLVICSGFFVDNLLQNRKAIELNFNVNLFKEYCMWQLKILTPSILFRKSFLENKELFSYRISRGQETELFSRLFFNLPEDSFKIINSPLFLYRQHEESKTTRNNEYLEKYKESQTEIAIKNLKMALEISDLDLINYYYRGLLDIFFRGLENNHHTNSRLILNSLIDNLKNIDKRLTLKLFFFGGLFLLINRGSFRVEKILKNYQII
jgi:glycosyltransferase involved in cell wall biosynthesis